MLKQENLAANFCGLLAQKGHKEKAIEWRILGQEQDGSLISTWIWSPAEDNSIGSQNSNIGIYNPKDKVFEVIYTFDGRKNIIQASVNKTLNLLLFVIKESNTGEESTFMYKPFIVELNTKRDSKSNTPIPLSEGNSHQILLQFLWKRASAYEVNKKENFLLLTHEGSIQLYSVLSKKSEVDNSDIWNFEEMKSETIVKHFTWAQWDSAIQALYYIHLKPSTRSILEKEDSTNDPKLCPTLSAYQFHDDLPMETVMNIPLNLPQIPTTENNQSGNTYEDDVVPLRIHDSSLNLIIVSDESGMLYVCHYYLFFKNSDDSETSATKTDDVHFAYSITILHHGCVIHCVIPGIPWDKAKLMKPTFTLHGDHHMLIFQAELFMHLLDTGLSHEPCCHIVCQPLAKQSITHLVPCFKSNSIAYDSVTLDLISINIPKSHLIEAFRNDNSVDNRISIVHYFMAHTNDLDIFAELLNIIMDNPLNSDTVALFKEALISGSFSSTKKGLPQDAMTLFRLLPLTTSSVTKPIQAKVFNLNVGLSHESLYNTNMMFLSPQQRLSPYRTDIWTLLYERLNDNKERARFNTSQVSEKLMYSLACYQPEALSRCSTPLTPSTSFSEMTCTARKNVNDVLPFIEFESCTASKQEHVISVILRELSMHLVKHSVKEFTGFRWLKDTYFDRSQAPSHVHAVATRYAASQLELSRALCIFVCRAAGVDARIEKDRGFQLIDQLSPGKQYALFLMLERYSLAVESLAFPCPQGFSSFFTYLGYRSLSFETFMQYIQRNAFELQIDVTKVILDDIEDNREGLQRKLSILSVLPRSRARRLLNSWNHPISIMLRGREHALNILSGNLIHPRGSSQRKRSGPINATTYQPQNKFSPLDTFLDLLTAKANLNELDFNLLIETTITSIHNSNLE